MTVMRLVVSGLLNKQVADELGITESTVKAQRDVVMQKMKARARKRALLGPRWFRRKQPNSFEKNGDETRTRHLLRDSRDASSGWQRRLILDSGPDSLPPTIEDQQAPT